VTEPAAEAMRATHRNRLRFAMFSDKNPAMQQVKTLAESVRAARKPVSADNPLLAMQDMMSSWTTTCLEMMGAYKDSMTETVFLNTYGSPLLQAMVGLGADRAGHDGVEREVIREADAVRMRAELESRFDAGGPIEAGLRALIYIRLPDGSVDERGFSVLKLIRASRPANNRISMARFKEMVREQYLLVYFDEERAVAALPKLLGGDTNGRKSTLDLLHRVLSARDDMSDEGKRRLARVEGLFNIKQEKAVAAEAAHA
jgi:hypothetical protein